MKKILAAICTAVLCVAAAFAAACGGGGDDPKPQKLKDGTAITLTEGDRQNINLAEYISLPENYRYEVSSSAEAVATVQLNGATATVTAVKKGSAKVTAQAGDVSVEFAVTVNEKSQQPDAVDKTALEAELELEVAAQGDYTEESYAAYAQKLEAAKVVNAKSDATQTEVDTACNELKNARLALALRVPAEKDGVSKHFSMLSGSERVLNIADYVDDRDLSKISYEVTSDNALVNVGTVNGTNVPLTAGATAAEATATLTISVKYDGVEKLSLEISVKVTAEAKPALKEEAIERNIDIYALAADEKQSITLNFAANIDNPANVELNYEVTLNGNPVVLDGEKCAVYNFDGNYTENATDVTFVVTVKYGQNNASVSYNYTLHITDTSAYRIANGTFDDGLNGWTLSNPKLGAVSNETHYWLNDEENAEGYPFYNEGNFFSAYANGEEAAMGTLTSSPFTIGGSGYITFKLGGTKNADKVFLDIIEKDTGAILARYHNSLWQERTEGVKSGCMLTAYKANLSAYKGKTVYIRISDNAENDYGLFFADSFVTYYNTVPEVSNTAEEQEHPANVKTGEAVSKYQVYNGGFESDLEGWTCVDGAIPGAVSSANRYWGADYGNTGKLFTAVEGHEGDTPRDPNLEHRMGTIRSEKFTLKANAWISFRLGGANYDTLGIRIVKTDGTVIARFQNTDVSSAGEGQLVQYKYHFDNAEEVECYIEIFDNEPNPKEGARPWRLVVVDEIITDLEAEPAEGLAATNQIS